MGNQLILLGPISVSGSSTPKVVSATPINTKTVPGRRAVRYENLDEFLAEAEYFATSNVRQLGNWSPGSIYAHLAKTMNSSIDGFDKLMPAPLRWILTMAMKRKFLSKAIPAGFKTDSQFVFSETSNEAGLALL